MKQILPDISVIVSCYNHDKWIERCLRSLNHQRFIEETEYEIVLVNDGSTDNTVEVLKNLSVIQNLRIVTNETNLGLPTSLNKAVQIALGRYIVRVDSDDYVHRQFLHTMKFFLDTNRSYQAAAVDYVKVNEAEESSKQINCFDEQIACGIMFRKECLFDIGLYDESFKMREGHDLRARFLKKFRIARIELPLYKYRDHAGNRTKDLDTLEKYDSRLNNEKDAR